MTTPSRRGRPRDPVMTPEYVPPSFLADHPALDLLNTEMRVDGQLVDVFTADEHVLEWLDHADMSSGEHLPRLRDEELLHLAIKLRANVRTLVERKRDGKPLDLAPLNEHLGAGCQRSVLVQEPDGTLRLEPIFERKTARDLLLPLALAAADLLVNGDFSLVRRCESEDCVLYFYDRTRSHRRRWCSAATCGNRDKVARFRERVRTRT